VSVGFLKRPRGEVYSNSLVTAKSIILEISPFAMLYCVNSSARMKSSSSMKSAVQVNNSARMTSSAPMNISARMKSSAWKGS